MTSIKRTGLVFAALIMGMTSSAFAQVESMSGATFEQYGDLAYWEIEVSCSGSDNVFVIQQVTRGVDWCLKGQPKGCQPDKGKLADKVCSGEIVASQPIESTKSRSQPTAVASKPEPVQAESNSARLKADLAAQEARERRAREAKAQRDAELARLRTEQFNLREQRIKIDQEKIEINQLELKLSTRAQAIEAQLKEFE